MDHIVHLSPEDEDIDISEVEFWDDYDHAMYDDDGEPIADEESGEVLIPYDPQREYPEEEALALTAFAGTYSEMRGKAQKDRFMRMKQKSSKSATEFGKTNEASVQAEILWLQEGPETEELRPKSKKSLQCADRPEDHPCKDEQVFNSCQML